MGRSRSSHLRLGLILLLTLLRLLGRGLLAAVVVAGLVHLVEEVQAGNLELIGLLLDLGSGSGTLTREVLGDELAESGELLLDGVSLGLVELVGILVESTLSVVQDAVGAVGSLDGTLALLISLSVLLRVLNHLLDLALRETGTGGNGDGLVLVGGLVLGVDVDDGISRSNIEEEKVLDLTRENSTLDSGTNGDSLIGVDGLGGVSAENALNGLSDLGHTGHTTNEDNLLDLLSGEASILKSLADRLDGAADKRVDHLLKLSSAELHVNVLGARRVGSDEGKVDIGGERRRKLDLGLLSSLTDTLDSHAVARQVNAGSLLEVLDKVSNKVDIEIFTTEMGITVGGLDLENTVLDLKDGDIEGTTTKIVDSDNAVSLLLETVGKSGGSRLVDDTEDVEAGNLTSVLGALSLRVVEVGGDGDDGVLDRLREVRLGGLLHLVEDETTDLRGRVVLATGSDPGVAVGVLNNLVRNLLDIALNLSILELSEEGVLWVNDGLTLSSDTDESLTILGESND
ncbi:unnamed protein product [Fusarium graminearum]|nr:unnamed protein product [Fusarium graminearum]